MPAPAKPPLIVGLGGATRAGSSSETAVRAALAHAEALGARTRLFDGPSLERLPHFAPERTERSPEQTAFVEAVRAADGLVVGSPAYHGGMSGLVKNALDLLEDLRDDARPYLHGRAVGLVVTAAGWQAGGVTLSALRDVAHALRGWPTPAGAAFNTGAGPLFGPDGRAIDPRTDDTLALVARQVMGFARMARGDGISALETAGGSRGTGAAAMG